MQLKTFITSGKYGPSGKYGSSELEEEINAFLASGIRVSFPPKIEYDTDGLWYAAIFYEQPSSPSINEADRQQRSLTKEEIELYDQNNRVECQRKGIPYDAQKEEKNQPRPYKRNMSL